MRADFKAEPVTIAVATFSSDHTPENDHLELIQRCLHGILERTDPRLYRLHVGTNNVSPRVSALVDDLCARGLATRHEGEAYTGEDGKPFYPKYPLMDAIYRATDSSWVVWFDDDSYPNEDDWLEALEHTINEHPHAHQFGKPAGTPVANTDRRWIQEAAWYNPDAAEHWIEIEEGWSVVKLRYIVGGFYAVSREAIERCSIPDPRLLHNGGDWTTGLALHHQGLAVHRHTYGVRINAAQRRGAHGDRARRPGEAAKLQDEQIRTVRQKYIEACAEESI